MKKVKITVLRKTFQEDLAKEYGVENLALYSIRDNISLQSQALHIHKL